MKHIPYVASAIYAEYVFQDLKTKEYKTKQAIIEEIPAPPLESLVLEGGGVRGMAYAGVVKALEISNILPELKNIAGSSIGAIAAMLIAVGYTTLEIEELLKTLPLNDFLEGVKPWSITPAFIVKGKQAYNIYYNEGHSLSTGTKLLDWLQKQIEKKLGKKNATFADLAALAENNHHYKLLHVTGSNLTKNRLKIFNQETSPNMPIALAVRISAAYPSVFEGVKYNPSKDDVNVETDEQKNKNFNDDIDNCLYLDGGLMNNLPSFIFQKRKSIKKIKGFENVYDFTDTGANPTVLNIKIDTKEEMDQILWTKSYEKAIKGFKEHTKAVLYALQSRDEEIYQQYSLNTIQVYDSGIETLQFDISEEEKNKLIDAGCDAAWQWITNHLSEAYKIHTYDNEEAWLQSKTQEELVEIRKIYQIMLNDLLNKNNNDEKFINELNNKIEFLKKYILYRAELVIDSKTKFNYEFTSHIDIKPRKPRINIDKKNKEVLKCLLVLLDRQIKVYQQRIDAIKADLDFTYVSRLHDTSVYEQIVYLSGFEEKNKILRKEVQDILGGLFIHPDEQSFSQELLASEQVAQLHRQLHEYKNSATSFFSQPLKFVNILDNHFVERVVELTNSDNVKINLDLVKIKDLKLYVVACMLYLTFIKSNDNLLNVLNNFYQTLFGSNEIPKNIDELKEILQLDPIETFVSAYKIESLINFFIIEDKPKLKIETASINLDLIFYSFLNLPLIASKRKKKNLQNEDELGIELNYMYQTIFPYKKKVSLYDRINLATSSFWELKEQIKTEVNKFNKDKLKCFKK